MEDDVILSGAISVKAAIKAGVRDVRAVFADPRKKTGDMNYIRRLAASKGIRTEDVSEEIIRSMAGDVPHGGVCALAGQRRYEDPLTLLRAENPFIMLLEGIEDPYNFGCCIRSAYAAGATGLIVPRRSWENAAATVVRSSAGASEFIPTACVEDISSVLEQARHAGIKVVAADRKDAVPLYEEDLSVPLIIAVGGHMRGLSSAVYAHTDRRVYIPYGNDFRNALSSSAACAVMAFEACRQRAANASGRV